MSDGRRLKPLQTSISHSWCAARLIPLVSFGLIAQLRSLVVAASQQPPASSPTMRTRSLPLYPPAGLSSVLLSSLLFASHFHSAFSIPQPLVVRQSPFAALQLPQCALPCFLTGLLADGCANETDFVCHCAAGNILGEAAPCIEQGCDTADEEDAVAKVRTACGAVGGGSQGQSTTRGRSLTVATSTASGSISSTFEAQSSASSQLLSLSGPTSLNSQFTPVQTPSQTANPSLATTILSHSISPSSTEPPLTFGQPSSQLSDGAKAGIAVSVSLLTLSIFIALGWYIRRLKRDLASAQNLSDEVWRASMNTVTAPALPGDRRERRNMSEVVTVSNNGYGVLKKKRGHVLSVVVEHEEEGSRPASTREPVPGQREGLAEPLELDGGRSSCPRIEMPLSITPRDRSLER